GEATALEGGFRGRSRAGESRPAAGPERERGLDAVQSVVPGAGGIGELPTTVGGERVPRVRFLRFGPLPADGVPVREAVPWGAWRCGGSSSRSGAIRSPGA